MLILVIAIGTTDLIFALDSIPAIFGLRHLYLLSDGLLRRLAHPSAGLAVRLVIEPAAHYTPWGIMARNWPGFPPRPERRQPAR